MYKCVNCGKVIKEELTKVRCPYCGFRILAKERPKTVKKVLAR
jgi:DNA-directed RNA polymerase subunit RPC12/RpoP